ncbi:acyltransferase family protein [Algihabitans albus]|uniref:acyltransferase family protein n=1 Tax=Algihabitans albus TaxID=2164067 RepID=UPI000E5CF012|nr:acyltransferase family protein [Algihabitans albus]
MPADQRKYFLDWLRVAAFALLIVYHIGMLYVPWDFHVKSACILEWLAWPMVALNPWRLALLFFISGVACRHLLDREGPGAFLRGRITRLLPILLLGVLVLVPPQSYLELRQDNAIPPGFLSFWLGHYLVADQSFGIILPTWNHLWFVAYLLVYAALLAGLAAALPRGIERLAGWVERQDPLVPLLAVGLWFAAANVLALLFRPDTHALVDDWAAHLRWLGLFLAGILLAKSGVWNYLEARRRPLARAAVLCMAGFLALRYGLRAGLVPDVWRLPLYGTAAAIFGWTMILALCGLTKAWFDRPSPLLRYLTRAILPFYALHQTVLILLAVALFACQLPVLAEMPLLFILTLAASWVLYELAIRKNRLFGPLFGLGQRAQAQR